MENIKMEAKTMTEYIIGGLIFAGIFIVPMFITLIIEKVKGYKNCVMHHTIK